MNLISISGKLGSGKDTVREAIEWLTSDHSDRPDLDNTKLALEHTGKNIPLGGRATWETKRFADKVKDIVCLLIGCTRRQLEDRDFKETPLGEEWKVWFIKHSTALNPIDKRTQRVSKYYADAESTKAEWFNRGEITKPFEIDSEVITPRLMLQLIGTDCGRDIIHPNIWVNSLFSEYKGPKLSQYNPSKWIIPDMRFPNEVEAVKEKGGLIIRVERNDWKPKAGETINIKVFSNYSIVTYTHTDEEGKHHGVGSDGYKYKSSIIKKYGEHPSETALDDTVFENVIVNNGSIEDLVYKVKELLIKKNII